MAEEEGEEPHSMEEVLDGIEEIAEEQDTVCLGDALNRFGHASFTPLLVILPLVELSPVGGIPGVPTALAVIVGLVALQMLLGRDHVWLPAFVENRGIDGDKLASAAHKLDSFAEKIDDLLGDRLDWLTKGIWVRVAAVFILLLCVTVPPLEVLPFASSAPMLAIAAFGLALLMRDGLLMLVGFVLSGLAVGLMAYSLFSGSGGG